MMEVEQQPRLLMTVAVTSRDRYVSQNRRSILAYTALPLNRAVQTSWSST